MQLSVLLRKQNVSHPENIRCVSIQTGVREDSIAEMRWCEWERHLLSDRSCKINSVYDCSSTVR
jgi:hypothetical protein